MRIKKIALPLHLLLTGIFLCMASLAFADPWDPLVLPKDSLKKDTIKPDPIEFKPMIGLGGGMFTFYGDVSNNNQNYHPTVSRLGYHLTVMQPLTKWLDFNFYVIHGSVAANERSLERNLNFESTITTGGLTLGYNFHHFIKEDRNVEPYIFTGIESFEFLSKTDLYDAHGNRYNYWSDGSIRNLPENAPNANSAIEIYRDYTYETDLRELNLDDFGKYPERSWAIPVGVGINFKMTEHWMFKFNTSMHFTLTDLVDNLSYDSPDPSRVGNKGNDKFLYTGFTINYNLHLKDKEESLIPEPGDDWDTTMYVYDDFDGDEVFDIIDDCPDTPEGVAVDEKGCPIDTDGDGVPDYVDDEVNTATGHIVDVRGVAVEDTVYWEAYARFVDSTGRFAEYTIERSSVEGTSAGPQFVAVKRPTKTRYTVEVGGESKEITPDMIDYILSLSDVTTEIDENGNVKYTIGNYDDLDPAIREKLGLTAAGIPSEIAGYQGDRKMTPDEIQAKIDSVNAANPTIAENPIDNPPTSDSKVIFRVQIGAFRNRLSKNVFKGTPELLTVEGNDGLTRYVTGGFATIEEAANRKVDMVVKGFDDAFITAYKDGKRITLAEAGATYVAPEPEDPNLDDTPSGIDKSRIKYSVQLGAFQSEVPTDMLDKFIELGNVDASRQDGVTKYTLGMYDTYEEAKAAATSMKGDFPDSFIVGRFNGNVISVAEANKLMQN